MKPKRGRNQTQPSAESKDQRATNHIEGRSSKNKGTGRNNPDDHAGETLPVGDASIHPMRVLGRGMQMGIDLDNDISGNPSAVPNANAGGPSSTQNIVGTKPESIVDQGSEGKQVDD